MHILSLKALCNMYNMLPQSGLNKESVPHRVVFRYEWQYQSKPSECPAEKREPVFVEVGDEVWVKPPKACCISQWDRGIVTTVNSKNNISVNEIPCHVLGVCRIVASSHNEGGGEEENKAPSLWKSQCMRCPTRWKTDFNIQ